MRALVGGVLAAFDTDEATRQAAGVLLPALGPLYAQLDPENVGGAMLLGVDGVCIISHGSSSATAMVNAIGVARDLVTGDIVEHLRRATTGA
jgi:phosphate acyltransferase